MRLATFIAVAEKKAAALGYDAPKWHRLACHLKEAAKKAAREKRRLERTATVTVPVEVDTGETFEEETE